MVATLEQQLADLASIHGLDRIEIVFSVKEARPRADVYLARKGKCQSDRLFGDNISAAFKDALLHLNNAAEVKFAPIEVAA